MKKAITVILVALMATMGVIGLSTKSYASDWDKAGKILTGIEGVRVLTGGRFDLIGNMFGINRSNRAEPARHKHQPQKRHYCTHRVWVPHYVWKRKYIPQHREYDDKHGEVIVEGHYIRYQVEQGGKWITTCKRR